MGETVWGWKGGKVMKGYDGMIMFAMRYGIWDMGYKLGVHCFRVYLLMLV